MDTKLFEYHTLTSEHLLEFWNLIVTTHGLIFGWWSPRRVVNHAQQEGGVNSRDEDGRKSSE